ncbi:MAG: hypothetical protein HYX60_11610, partial [Legionella longbeachae]|nr:hypothetical protein [Legionella longbeachae]
KNSTIKVINGSLIIEGTIESGTKILVSNNLKNETAFKFKVWGHIQDSVSIQSDVAIEILGNIGDRCFIKSNYAGLKARNIGKEATIDVLEKIVADHIGKYSRLFSRQQGLTAEELDDNVLVNVIGEIDINENIGNRCNLKNQKGGLIAGNIGKYVTIDVGGNIQVCDIDIGSILNSKKGGLKAHDIGNKVTVNVRNKIHVNNLEDECKIYSQKSGIKVDGKTRSDLELEARDDIKMNDMGKCCSVKSTHGKITFENSGDSVFITARYLVKGIGVGKCSQIISTKDSVHLKYLLRDVKINAEHLL